MKKSTPLTTRQKQVLKILHDAEVHRGISPTIREIQEEFSFKSSRAVVGHLIALERKGYIKREGGVRGTRIIKYEQHGKKPRNSVCYLPLVGQVAAGTPLFAEENVEEWVPVPSNMKHCNRSFILRAKGDSMIDAHILDGDLLVVCPEHQPEQDDIVVALIDDEATVKRLVKRGRRIQLNPENPKYAPIVVTKDQRFIIQGIVVGSLRIGNKARLMNA